MKDPVVKRSTYKLQAVEVQRQQPATVKMPNNRHFLHTHVIF